MASASRVLISEDISARCLERLRAEPGVEVDYRPEMRPAELLGAIGGFDALVIRSRTRVTAEAIAAAARLRVVGRAGTGVDNVDVPAATKAGIVVMNVPGGNTISAAEHTFSLMLALARRIAEADASMRAGRWDRQAFLGSELQGKTLGILGLGRIGREVASRARAFGMEVIGHDPFVSPELMEGSRVAFVPLEEIFRRADFITVHAPLTPQTRNLVGTAQLALCRPGARIVNCARGGIVDEAAVAAALREGRLAGAAFDVYEHEPPPAFPFEGVPNVLCTPHLAASTEEAQERVAADIAEQVCEYLRDGVARNAVNLPVVDAATLRTAGPYLDLAVRIGRLQAQLLDGNPVELLVECAGEISPEATGLLATGVLRGFLETITSRPINAVNASLTAREHGIRLQETRTAEATDYTSLLTVAVETTAGRRAISGTLFGRNLPRIVELDGYRFDALPEGTLLLVSNDDRPGIVGLVGTTLGRERINIAYMSVGRDRSGGRAIAILNVDSEVPERVLEEVRKAPGILWVRTAAL